MGRQTAVRKLNERVIKLDQLLSTYIPSFTGNVWELGGKKEKIKEMYRSGN